MKATKSALLVGVGGQGAILTAKVLVNGLMKAGYDVKMSEVHGMSQRGGSVSTQVHWGEKVYSPVIGKGAADIIVAFEKMEAVRYADYLKPDGVAVINDYEIASSSIAAGLCEYPDGCLEAMQQHFRCHVLKAGEIAEQLGNAKCMNIVLFGSMAKALGADGVQCVGSKFVIYRRSEKKAQEAARQARELKKRKSNPVRRGAQERRRQAREERERRNEYFRQAAIQAAIERRKSREE